jgi:hypothetical protein
MQETRTFLQREAQPEPHPEGGCGAWCLYCEKWRAWRALTPSPAAFDCIEEDDGEP